MQEIPAIVFKERRPEFVFRDAVSKKYMSRIRKCFGADTSLYNRTFRPYGIWLEARPTGTPVIDDRMVHVNVRRLAAIDMHGIYGTRFRRRLILAEFLIGAAALVPFGTWQLTNAIGPADRLFGLWLIGTGLNYVPLSAYALALTRPGALAKELTGVDATAELRRYTVFQLWVLVPLSLVILAARQTLARNR
jgi:hypothetical protein